MSRKEEEKDRIGKEKKKKVASNFQFSIFNLRLFISKVPIIVVIELERAYGSHDANQICTFLLYKGSSYWVQAPLAHLRSAGEVATNPAITNKSSSILFGNCIIIIIIILSRRAHCRPQGSGAVIVPALLADTWWLWCWNLTFTGEKERRFELIPTNARWYSVEHMGTSESHVHATGYRIWEAFPASHIAS